MSRTKILELTWKTLMTIALIAMPIAQGFSQEKTVFRLLEFKYGFHLPAADLRDRFGSSSAIGLGVLSADTRTNLFFGIEGNFMFGNTVKEDVLAGLRAYDGTIIGLNGRPGDIVLKERAFYAGINGGKIFKLTDAKNNLTGFRTQFGLGLLQHKIRVQDNGRTVVPLEKDKLIGYDRLTNGPALHIAFGYQYQSAKNNLHFNILGDVFAASTASRRDFDNATVGKLEENRIDILAGLSVSWVVLISRRSAPENIYY